MEAEQSRGSHVYNIFSQQWMSPQNDLYLTQKRIAFFKVCVYVNACVKRRRGKNYT